MGMLNDLIGLIQKWLTGRSFYVQIGGDCSALFNSTIIKILNIYIMPLCTHLYHTSFQYLFCTCNGFIAYYIRR